MDPVLQAFDSAQIQPPAATLIGEGGVGKTVGKHPASSRQRRQDYLVQVFTPGCEHEQGLGLEVHRLCQQQLAQFFPEGRASRLPRYRHFLSCGFQATRDPVQVGALAGAVHAFQRYELAAHLSAPPRRWYLATARSCSAMVCENSLEPSPRATKYRAGVFAGFSAACSEAWPGMAMGVGGSPVRV